MVKKNNPSRWVKNCQEFIQGKRLGFLFSSSMPIKLEKFYTQKCGILDFINRVKKSKVSKTPDYVFNDESAHQWPAFFDTNFIDPIEIKLILSTGSTMFSLPDKSWFFKAKTKKSIITFKDLNQGNDEEVYLWKILGQGDFSGDNREDLLLELSKNGSFYDYIVVSMKGKENVFRLIESYRNLMSPNWDIQYRGCTGKQLDRWLRKGNSFFDKKQYREAYFFYEKIFFDCKEGFVPSKFYPVIIKLTQTSLVWGKKAYCFKWVNRAKRLSNGLITNEDILLKNYPHFQKKFMALQKQCLTL